MKYSIQIKLSWLKGNFRNVEVNDETLLKKSLKVMKGVMEKAVRE